MKNLIKKWDHWMKAGTESAFLDVGLLVLRLGAGGLMFLLHGVDKLLNFGEKVENFPDPIGLGSTLSLLLATGAEFFAALCVLLGLFTRLATLPLLVTMAVAAFLVKGMPLGNMELPLFYLIAYVAILIAGPGKISIDQLIRKWAARG